MTLQSQWKLISGNWLIIVLILVIIAAFNFNGSNPVVSQFMLKSYGGTAENSYQYSRDGFSDSIMPVPSYPSSAPLVTERKITKSAYLSSEVPRDSFRGAEQTLRGIVISSHSIMLSENAQKQGTQYDEYYAGTYTIQVDTTQYDNVVNRLKQIGEVQSFNENAQDITGEYTNSEINLATEKARLIRYQALYTDAKEVKDKLEISDRIFEQERTVRYLEDAMQNMDERVSYSIVQVSITEKQSTYAGITLVKASELMRNFVDSLNGLAVLLVSIIPWALLALLGYGVWRFVKK